MIGNYRIMKIKSLTIYCSSSEKLDQKLYDLSEEIGEFLAQNQIIIIYGGGNIGLMGRLSNAAIKKGRGYSRCNSRIFEKRRKHKSKYF